jgi:hypothetical protein
MRRAILSTIAGSPGRAAVSAAFLTAVGFLVAGFGRELLISADVAIPFLGVALLLWVGLAAAGVSAGVAEPWVKEREDA